MMDSQLTITRILHRAVDLYADREIVTKQPDGSVHRYTYDDWSDRVAQLASGLDELGISPDARVASVAENHYRHLELYFGPACSGRSLHMCNHRLPDEHFQYIINNAEDEILFVDPQHLHTVEANADELETVQHYVILDDEVPDTDLQPVSAYEDLLADQPREYDWPDLDEDRECGICHTSGTTGKPKGCPYTHRALWLHSMMLGHTDSLAIGQGDVAMPIVPMFHVNAWGMPYAAAFVGAKQVLPGGAADPGVIANLIADEEVTICGGVPTIWLEMADYLDDNPEVDISALDRIIVGGSAPPESLIRRYDEEYDAPIIEVWGMTETTPIATLSALRKELTDLSPDERYTYRAKAGLPVLGVNTRIRDEEGNEVPRDGESTGELEVRGPWIIDGYLERPDANEASFTDDGWMKTGDIATQDEWGYINIVDRVKDVIKSGGEWISSVELENELMAHEAVAEASVIGIPHEKWQERPLALVVPDSGAEVTEEELIAHLAEEFPKWWLPDRVEFIDKIPQTSTGKFDKKTMRDQFADVDLETEREKPEPSED